MIIELKKFGTTLVFRERGREAFTAFEPDLKGLPEKENIIVDFAGVITFSPSWGDEFLSPLLKTHGDRLILKNTSNSSVQATIKTLNTVNKPAKFNVAG